MRLVTVRYLYYFIYQQLSIPIICRFDIVHGAWNQRNHIHVCFTSALYLDLLLKLDINGTVTTQLYDKQNNFNFSILNFPYLCSNIPSSPAYGAYMYILQLIRYAKACLTCDQSLIQGSLLTNKMMSQGFYSLVYRQLFANCTVVTTIFCQYNLPLYQIMSDVFHTNR
jgi:hypothetical protein